MTKYTQEHAVRGVARISGQGGQQKPRWGQKISGPQHFKSPPPSTTFLVKIFPDNNIIIAFVALFPISVFSMLRHEDSDNIDNFPTCLNMKLYNQGFPFLYNTFYQGGGGEFCQGGGPATALATPLHAVSRETGVAEKPVIFGRAHSQGLVRAGVHVTGDAGQGIVQGKSAHWVNLPPCPSVSQRVSHIWFSKQVMSQLETIAMLLSEFCYLLSYFFMSLSKFRQGLCPMSLLYFILYNLCAILRQYRLYYGIFWELRKLSFKLDLSC
jgi:hypothetical protein